MKANGTSWEIRLHCMLLCHLFPCIQMSNRVSMPYLGDFWVRPVHFLGSEASNVPLGPPVVLQSVRRIVAVQLGRHVNSSQILDLGTWVVAHRKEDAQGR